MKRTAALQKGTVIGLLLIAVFLLCPSSRAQYLARTNPPLMIINESIDVLEARQGFATCPLCGTSTLLNRVHAQANTSFGSSWAFLLDPGDSPDFPTFLSDVANMQSKGIPFVIDVYTSDIERFTSSWAYSYNNNPSGSIFQPPFLPSNTGYSLMLSPSQLSQVLAAAPTSFIGVRAHEVPVMEDSAPLNGLLQWITAHGMAFYVNPGSSAWFPSWVTFINQNPGVVTPLVANNFAGSLDSNWSTAVSLYKSGVVNRLGWSMQTFYIFALTQQAVDPSEAPVDPFGLFLIYGYNYGGSVFELEPDSAVFTLDGFLTDTGKIATRFFQDIRSRNAIPPRASSDSTFGVFATDMGGDVCSSCAEWMGPAQLSWNTVANASNSFVLSYQVAAPTSDANENSSTLIAVWNPGPLLSPSSVTIGGEQVQVLSGFEGFGSADGAWYDGGNVTYIQTHGSTTVTIQYSPATGMFVTDNSLILPIRTLLDPAHGK